MEHVKDNKVVQIADLKFNEHVSTNTEKSNVMIDLIQRSAMSRRSAFQGTFHLVCMTPFLMWSGNLGYVFKNHSKTLENVQLSYTERLNGRIYDHSLREELELI